MTPDPTQTGSSDDVIEVVYMRHHSTYLYEAESIEGALSFIEHGQDAGEMWTYGVYVNAEPRIWNGYVGQEPPTAEQAEQMRQGYRDARRDA